MNNMMRCNVVILSIYYVISSLDVWKVCTACTATWTLAIRLPSRDVRSSVIRFDFE